MPTAPKTFRPLGASSRPEQKREADKLRGSARERGYTARWDRASLAFLYANPLCLGCQAAGWIKAAELTDHIVPHQGDQSLFWDRDNWQPSCRWHHDVIKQQLENEWRRGRLKVEALRLDSIEALKATRGGVESLEPLAAGPAG